VVVDLLLAGIAAVCCVHSSHCRRNDVVLDVPRLLLLTGVLRPVYCAKYLVRLLADLVELGLICLLPLVKYVEMAFIVV
jgi:hypothetical protein